MISGGSSSSETTFFDYRINQWSVGPKLNLARGYHTQTVLATGDVLTVGGSWSGSSGGKRDGEVWNPRTNVWRTLSNMPSLPLQTADREGTYRSDNHYWLFLAPNGKVGCLLHVPPCYFDCFFLFYLTANLFVVTTTTGVPRRAEQTNALVDHFEQWID